MTQHYILKLLIISGLSFFFWTCETSERQLPILGERDLAANGDTIYPRVPDFSFINQDSQIVTNATFAGRIYVVDFFFIHCPTICPKVTANCWRIFDQYKNDPRVGIIAHTVDSRNDTVAALRRHALKLGVTDTRTWHFVTGKKDEIYGIADKYYAVTPKEDPDAPGGFDHDGRIILVDKNRHVRSFCDGTNADEVKRFMDDVDILLREQFGSGK